MRRIQVQLDDETYRALKQKAFERGVSMSALLRELLRAEFNPSHAPRRFESFRFIGSGHSGQGGLAPISEHHDEALVEDLPPAHRRSLKGSLAPYIKTRVQPGQKWDAAREAAWHEAAERKVRRR